MSSGRSAGATSSATLGAAGRQQRAQVRLGEPREVLAQLTPAESRLLATLIDAARAWQARRVDAGFGAITWGPDWGGPGLTAGHEPHVLPRLCHQSTEVAAHCTCTKKSDLHGCQPNAVWVSCPMPPPVRRDAP
mgnify:CR=1 FL=1